MDKFLNLLQNIFIILILILILFVFFKFGVPLLKGLKEMLSTIFSGLKDTTRGLFNFSKNSSTFVARSIGQGAKVFQNAKDRIDTFVEENNDHDIIKAENKYKERQEELKKLTKEVSRYQKLLEYSFRERETMEQVNKLKSTLDDLKSQLVWEV